MVVPQQVPAVVPPYVVAGGGVPFLTASSNPWKLGLRWPIVSALSSLAISSEITAVYARSPNKFLRWSFGF